MHGHHEPRDHLTGAGALPAWSVVPAESFIADEGRSIGDGMQTAGPAALLLFVLDQSVGGSWRRGCKV